MIASITAQHQTTLYDLPGLTPFHPPVCATKSQFGHYLEWRRWADRGGNGQPCAVILALIHKYEESKEWMRVTWQYFRLDPVREGKHTISIHWHGPMDGMQSPSFFSQHEDRAEYKRPAIAFALQPFSQSSYSIMRGFE